MNVEKLLRSRLEKVVTQKLKTSWPQKAQITPPKEDKFGDLSTNLALILAQKLKQPPRQIAETIKNHLDSLDLIQKIEIAGPGFLNFFFNPTVWQRIILDILEQKENFAKNSFQSSPKVQIEFVSANPTGPLHIGHGRGAAVGDSLARIMRHYGYEVQTEYYINDAGRQIKLLGQSVLARYFELLGQKSYPFPQDGYKGKYIYDLAQEIIEKKQDLLCTWSEDQALEFCTQYAKDKILADIQDDLNNFRVKHEVWFSEKSLLTSGKLEQTLDYLRSQNLIYEKDGALWFKSTLFGDDKDRVLKKSDGSLTYFASDICYHFDKFKRGFDLVIDIWGADHHGYVPRMKAAVQAIGQKPEQLQVILVQLVNLLRGGQQVAMSTRSGEFITLREVYTEVGVDATRYMFLSRKSDSHLDFDLELVKKKSMDNPVYYVQYAHARICSIFKKAEEKQINYQPEPDYITLLTAEQENKILKHLYRFPQVLSICAEQLAPHHLSYYLYDLASLLHSYYTEHPILTVKNELRQARLMLLLAIKYVLKISLNLLGVSAPEKM